MLERDKPFHFDKDCLQVFGELNKTLITTPVVIFSLLEADTSALTKKYITEIFPDKQLLVVR